MTRAPSTIALPSTPSDTEASVQPHRVLVGRFGAPQGVKGEIRIKSYTTDPMAIAAYSPLMDLSGSRQWRISTARPLRDDLLVARIEDLTDRDAASALTGVNLYIERKQLPPEDDEEFYITDLIGATVSTIDGGYVGVLRNVVNYGAGDLLEIDPTAGDKNTEQTQEPARGEDVRFKDGGIFLIPFTKACVPEVNLNSKRIVIIFPISEE